MQGTTADKWETQTHETVLVAAPPKVGKTLFATTAPTPMVIIAADLGKLSIAPWQDRSQILVLPYQELTRVMGDLGTSVPNKDVFQRLMRDLKQIANSLRSGDDLTLDDGTVFPKPETVIIDGFSRINNMVVDGKLAMNSQTYVDDLPKEIRFNFWGKRMSDIYTLVQTYGSIGNTNVIITAWTKPQSKMVEGKLQETGVTIPDIGGAMDLKSAGVVASALFLKARQGKYYALTKQDASYPWVGVRDAYDLDMEVELTFKGSNKPPVTPWNRIFKPLAPKK